MWKISRLLAAMAQRILILNPCQPVLYMGNRIQRIELGLESVRMELISDHPESIPPLPGSRIQERLHYNSWRRDWRPNQSHPFLPRLLQQASNRRRETYPTCTANQGTRWKYSLQRKRITKNNLEVIRKLISKNVVGICICICFWLIKLTDNAIALILSAT